MNHSVLYKCYSGGIRNEVFAYELNVSIIIPFILVRGIKILMGSYFQKFGGHAFCVFVFKLQFTYHFTFSNYAPLFYNIKQFPKCSSFTASHHTV
jgi:hypothetical protein